MNKNSRNLKILKDIVGIEQFKVIAERLNGEHIVFNIIVARDLFPKKNGNRL